METPLQILTKAGLENTYWGKKILAAYRRGKFTKSNVQHALGWQTCACGRQTHNIGVDGDGVPSDSMLATLGGRFYHLVGSNEFVTAAITMVEIEKRAAIVARKEHA